VVATLAQRVRSIYRAITAARDQNPRYFAALSGVVAVAARNDWKYMAT
jgi:hypothetical protein